eukprot:9486032-Pyramimonas_sp.AAC.2
MKGMSPTSDVSGTPPAYSNQQATGGAVLRPSGGATAESWSAQAFIPLVHPPPLCCLTEGRPRRIATVRH